MGMMFLGHGHGLADRLLAKEDIIAASGAGVGRAGEQAQQEPEGGAGSQLHFSIKARKLHRSFSKFKVLDLNQ
jgi:hypothetical protein